MDPQQKQSTSRRDTIKRDESKLSKGNQTVLSEARGATVTTFVQKEAKHKPNKYIIYPKSMQVVPYVDLLEEQLALEKPQRPPE